MEKVTWFRDEDMSFLSVSYVLLPLEGLSYRVGAHIEIKRSKKYLFPSLWAVSPSMGLFHRAPFDSDSLESWFSDRNNFVAGSDSLWLFSIISQNHDGESLHKIKRSYFFSSQPLSSFQRITSLLKLFDRAPAELSRESALGALPNRAVHQLLSACVVLDCLLE